MARTTLHRTTARVLPVSRAGEVLLLHGWDPAAPEAPFWFSVGGALEPGEDHRAAAAREMHEETGVRIDPAALVELGSAPAEFDWGEYHLVQEQTWFACPLEPTATHFEGLEEAEVGTIDEARWWSPEALAASGETTFDPLLSMARAAVEKVVP
jgi:8-oxo-dGTP pyrophosphatase MutT (NUDIX family)